ncbi:MAG TPA: serine/threonine-protein kinase [Planctomycetaceae bacterium]|jgi:serine/threonine-protein kinase
MNHEATHYDLDCLKRLLDDALPDPLAGTVAEHLAECDSCRGRFESLAGQPQWWSRACHGVKEILAEPAAYLSSTGSLEVGGLDGGSDSERLLRVAGARQPDSGDDSYASDFAVDFLEPSGDPAMLGKLGHYEIVEVIGRGGMGIVLRGFQQELNRYVAVKVLAPHLAQSAAARKRFAREAQAAAAVVHPHVMAIHAVAANAKLPYLVMPFIACESLQQRLDRHGPLDVKDVLRIGLQAAHGLAAAHAQGLVHRDVKPANILLEKSVDRVMLTDFGLARAVDDATLTRTGIIAGTPQYMSPEQANGDAVDHRSDLFSLGSVLYAMCTGRPPFRAETTFGVLRRIRETPPRRVREINADIPGWLETIVLKLLSKDAGDRLPSAAEVATLLEQCLAHVQQPATVGLPHVARGLVPAEPSAKLCAADRQSKNRRTSTLRRWLVFGLVAVLAIGLGLFSPFTKRKASTDTAGDSRPVTPAEPSTFDPILEWNSTQTQLEASASDIESLEMTSQQDLNGIDSPLSQSTDSSSKVAP